MPTAQVLVRIRWKAASTGNAVTTWIGGPVLQLMRTFIKTPTDPTAILVLNVPLKGPPSYNCN